MGRWEDNKQAYEDAVGIAADALDDIKKEINKSQPDKNKISKAIKKVENAISAANVIAEGLAGNRYDD